jgi:hypothetical protein
MKSFDLSELWDEGEVRSVVLTWTSDSSTPPLRSGTAAPIGGLDTTVPTPVRRNAGVLGNRTRHCVSDWSTIGAYA